MLSMLRQDAGMAGLQSLFDQLDRSQKLVDELRVEAIQANFTPGKVEQIIGEKPSPYFYKEEFGRYEIALELGNNTTTQRQQNFAQLLQLQDMGVTIPKEQLIKASTLQNKKELIEAIMQQEQAAQQQMQQQAMVEMEESKARTELAKSRAIADQGLGMERISRIEENHALARERDAAAIKDEETGFLDLIKGLKELDTIDLSHLQQAIAIMGMIKQQEQAALQPAMAQPAAKGTAKTQVSKIVGQKVGQTRTQNRVPAAKMKSKTA
jgi:hypothetical protein